MTFTLTMAFQSCYTHVTQAKINLQSLHLASVLIVDLAIQRENSEDVSQASLKYVFLAFLDILKQKI